MAQMKSLDNDFYDPSKKRGRFFVFKHLLYK